jgi:hypothetical protein
MVPAKRRVANGAHRYSSANKRTLVLQLLKISTPSVVLLILLGLLAGQLSILKVLHA